MLLDENITKNVTLIHRRKEFRAKQANLNKLEQNTACKILKEFNINKIEDNKIFVENTDKKIVEIKYDYIIVQYGLQVNKSTIIQDLEIETDDKNKILVNQEQSTNIKGVYSIGNACNYKGKTNVISVSLGEAVNAVTGVSFHINPNTSPIFYTTAIKNKN
jgi:thioredoxin reductase